MILYNSIVVLLCSNKVLPINHACYIPCYRLSNTTVECSWLKDRVHCFSKLNTIFVLLFYIILTLDSDKIYPLAHLEELTAVDNSARTCCTESSKNVRVTVPLSCSNND